MKEGWEYKKLGEVCEIYQPKTISSDMLVRDGKYLVYGANGVIGRYNLYNHEQSEVLMTCRGATCGTINISQPYSWINGNAMVIHPKGEDISQTFLKHLLRGIDLSIVITGAAQPQITRQSLKPIIIPVPPLSEQKRIVEELDLLSSIIEKKKAQLKELDSLAQSIFYDMFGDNNYEIVTLGEVVEIKSTLVSPTDLPYSEMLHVSPSNIISNVGSIVDCVKAKEESLISGKYTFSKGMILYSKIRPNLNKVAIPNFDGICSADMYPLSIKGKVNSIFIWRLLLSKGFLEYAIKHSGRARMPKLNREALFAYRFPLPPLPLQQQFAEKVEAIEHQKEMIKQSIKEVETLINSRMDYYFNG